MNHLRAPRILLPMSLLLGCKLDSTVRPDATVVPDTVPLDAPPPTGTPRWAIAFGDSGWDAGTGLHVDRDGTIVAGGAFEGAIDVGGSTRLTSAGMRDIYLTRRGADGTLLAGARYGGTDDDNLDDLTVLPSGNVALAGTFAGTTDLGGHAADGPMDGMFAVTTTSLAQVWSGTVSGFYYDRAHAIATDGTGHVVVGGEFAYNATVAATTLVGDGLDGWVASFDATGTPGWAKDLGGGSQMNGPNDVVTSLATDDAGNVYAAGHFEKSADLAGTQVTAAGSYDLFLIKWDRDGAVQWVKTLGGAGDDLDPRIAVDAARNVYLTAHFNGTASFGGAPLTAPTGNNSVVAKYDTSGAYVWQLQTTANLWGLAITGHEVHVAGAFAGSLDLGNGQTLTSAGGDDVFVGHVVDGAFARGVRFGGPMNDGALRLAVTPEGADVITGAFEATASFGPFTLTSKGGPDAFLVELAP